MLNQSFSRSLFLVSIVLVCVSAFRVISICLMSGFVLFSGDTLNQFVVVTLKNAAAFIELYSLWGGIYSWKFSFFLVRFKR